MSSDIKDKTISGFKWNGLLMASNMLLNSLVVVILGYILSPTDFGQRAIVVFILGLSRTFSEFGISQAIIQKEKINTNELHSVFTVNVLVGLVMCIIINALAPFLAIYYKEPLLTELLHFASIVFLIEPLSVVFVALLERELNFKKVAILNINRTLVMNVAIIVTALFGFGAFSFIIGQLLAAVVFLVALYISFRRNNLWTPKLKFKLSDIKPYYSFGIYVSGKNILNYFGGNIDELIVGKMLGIEALGYYSFAKQLLDKIIVIVTQISTKVTYPVFCRIQKVGDQLLFNNTYLKMTHFAAVLGLPIFSLVFLYIPDVSTVLFGAKWENAYLIMQIIALKGMVDILSSGFATNALYAYNSTKSAFYVDLYMIPIRIVSLYIACTINLTAVAIAYPLFILIKAIVLQWQVNRTCRMTSSDYFAVVRMPLLVSFILTAIFYLFTRIHLNIFEVAALSILFMAIYVSATFIFDKQTALDIINEARKIVKRKQRTEIGYM